MVSCGIALNFILNDLVERFSHHVGCASPHFFHTNFQCGTCVRMVLGVTKIWHSFNNITFKLFL